MIKELINDLIVYAKTHLELDELDSIYVKNLLLGELNIEDPSELNHFNIEEIKGFEVPNKLYDSIKSALISELDFSDDDAEIMTTKLFGLVTPLPSVVVNKFNNIYKEKGDEEALDYLYKLSIANNYFKKTYVEKNIVWSSSFDKRNIEVSINLSKPEKSNKDVAKLLKSSSTSYPKCLLCLENLGYKGRSNHPARTNLRVVPVKLDNDTWYIQYSPFGYFYKHSIVFSNNHSNMIIDKSTIRKLFDFVDCYPSFFIGSNADLPIVGGSILNHEHFQGGAHILPAMKQGSDFEFDIKNKKVKVSKLDWYNSTILLEGKDKEEMIEVANKILIGWRSYDDVQNSIISQDVNGSHNTITPALRKDKDLYKLYLILRNNRCDEANPDGIFHAHKEYHAIKKEGIGLIEALGLFILPGRLKRQKKEIKDVLIDWSNNGKNPAKLDDLIGFEQIIDDLFVKYNPKTIDQDIDKYIENVCKNILINTAVFKETEEGIKGFKNFIKSLNL